VLAIPWNRAERSDARVMMPVKKGAMRENHDIPTISTTDYARLSRIATSRNAITEGSADGTACCHPSGQR